MGRITTIVAFFFNGFFCFSQEKPLFFNTLTQSDGLSQSTNAFMYKDSRGFIWISSINGLNKFNGRNIEVFSNNELKKGALLGGNIQSTFFENDSGDIWFTTDRAVNCYRWKKDFFDHYLLKNTDNSLSITPYYAIKLDQSEFLWVVSKDTLFKLDTRNSNSNAFEMVMDLPEGAVRYGLLNNKNGGVEFIFSCYWDSKRGFEMIKLDQGYQHQQRQEFFGQSSDLPLICRQVICINENEIYFATDQGLLFFNPSNCSDYKLYTSHEIDKSIQHIQLINEGKLLTVSSKGFIYEFDFLKKTFSKPLLHKSINNSTLPPKEIIANCSYLSKDSVLLYAKYGEGVFYANYKYNNFFTHTFAAQWNQKNYVTTHIVEVDNNDIYCFNRSNRFMQIKDGKTYNYLTDGHYPFINKRINAFDFFSIGNNLKDLEQDKYIKKLKSIVIKGTQPLKFHTINWKKDTLLMGSMNGLFYLAPQGKELTKIPIIDCCVTDLFLDNSNHIWVGSTDKLLLYTLNSAGSLKLKSVYKETGYVNTIVSQNSEASIILIGSSKGLFKAVGSKVEQVLGGNQDIFVYSVVIDNKNRIWISSDKGVLQLELGSKGAKINKQITKRNGLNYGEYCPDASLYSSTGHIWFGSTKGVDVFHPDSIHDLGHAPQLAIVGLKIHDQAWRGDSAIEVVRRIDLPYNQNTLRLELAAMEYLNPAYNKFKVLLQLEGEDAKWDDLGTQNFVTFANLKPGRYTFKFIACNAEGIWVEEKDAKTLWLIIYPHWSDTWWFRALLAALLLGFVATATAFYYRYQLRAQQLQSEKQQREAERQRLELEKNAAVAEEQRKVAESEMKLLRSQLNPHFLFNAMNSINRYILSNEKDKASEYLGQFAQLTRSILDNSRSLTIPLADELKMLHHYLALENHRFQQNIQWTFTVSPDLDEEDVLVPSMFLQPFAENAILHGLAPKGGGHIALEISQHDGGLQCVLRDDGVGRQPAAAPADGKPRHASVGMRLIAERLHAFAGLQGQSAAFVLHDLKDEAGLPLGTEVVIRLPLVMAV